MFHKALWMRQWKQGKYIILLFWLTSLYQLPYKYYQEAQTQLKLSKMKFGDYTYYYSYYFQTSDGAVFFQGATLIALACLLIDGNVIINQMIFYSRCLLNERIFFNKMVAWCFEYYYSTNYLLD